MGDAEDRQSLLLYGDHRVEAIGLLGRGHGRKCKHGSGASGER